MKSLLGSLLNKAPVPYVGRAQASVGVNRLNNNATTQMAAMGQVGTLFAIVDRLAVSTAMVEWDLWRKAPSGVEEERTSVPVHAALSLWGRPNPWMTRLEFTEVSGQYLDLVGEVWWLIARNNRVKMPLELWPARPDRMRPVADAKEFITGYIYTAPDGEEVPLGTDEVIRYRRPDPLDVYRGMAAVQTILADLDANRLSAEWYRNFFYNSAEPGGIIEVDRRLDDDEFDQLRTRWAEQHRGVAAAHRVALIEQGMKWVDRNLSQRDMQFVEMRAAGRDVVREAFGVPKFVLGDVEDVNRASARESSVFFNQYLVVPRLERIKATLNAFLLPMYGSRTQNLEFDYRSPVPPDRQSDNEEMTAKTEGAKALVDAGYDPEGVLEAVGLPQIDWVGPPNMPEDPAKQETESAPNKSQSNGVKPKNLNGNLFIGMGRG